MQFAGDIRHRRFARHRRVTPAAAALLAATAGLVVAASPAAASTLLTPPYSSVEVSNQPVCYVADVPLSGPPPVGQCNLSVNSSASTGEMTGSAILQSPENGVAPWHANLTGETGVVATYHLASPTASLPITVNIHVNSSSVTVTNSLPVVPNGVPDLVAEPTLGNWSATYVAAIADEVQCSPNCVTGADDFAAARWVSGTTSVTGKDYTFHLTLSNSCGTDALGNPIPCDLPAGDVQIIPEVLFDLREEGMWGTETEQIDAVATSISVG